MNEPRTSEVVSTLFSISRELCRYTGIFRGECEKGVDNALEFNDDARRNATKSAVWLEGWQC